MSSIINLGTLTNKVLVNQLFFERNDEDFPKAQMKKSFALSEFENLFKEELF